MPLVSYVDSDEEVSHEIDCHQAVKPAPLKRSHDEQDDEASLHTSKPPPALPSNFHSLYASNARVSTIDDPALHGGRQRHRPHVVGNWPSFVYLEWLPSEQDLAILDDVIASVASQFQCPTESASASPFQSSLRSDLGVRLPLHVSLSTPLMLTTDNKEMFEHGLTAAIKDLAISAFRVVPKGLRWVNNFDKSRRFLIVTLKPPGGDELQLLLTTCNQVAKIHTLPELYAGGKTGVVGVPRRLHIDDELVPLTKPQDHDKFHISIGWSLSRPDPEAQDEGDTLAKLGNMSIEFKEVCIKIGNQISTVPLG